MIEKYDWVIMEREYMLLDLTKENKLFQALDLLKSLF